MAFQPLLPNKTNSNHTSNNTTRMKSVFSTTKAFMKGSHSQRIQKSYLGQGEALEFECFLNTVL